MSRTYFVRIYFNKKYPIKMLKDFFIKWCGEEQIHKIEPDYVAVIMGCSSGVHEEDSMRELKDQLIEQKFDVEGIYVYSLHPDDIKCCWSKDD